MPKGNDVAITAIEQDLLNDDTAVSHRSTACGPLLRDKLGICQWFHFEDYAAVRQTVRLLKEIGEALSFAVQLLAGCDAVGGFGADDEHAAHSGRGRFSSASR